MKTPGHTFIAITILFFIGWLAVTSSKWEAVGCDNSIKLSLTYGAPEWYQFCNKR